MHYQPKIEFDSPVISGFEALARWHHPDYGVINPRDFIPALERTAAIKDVTFHTIASAFEQQKAWYECGVECPIALNISKRMLSEPKFPAQIEKMIAHYNVPGELFNFEFSEIGTLKNLELATKIMWELSEVGIRVSIGDFGAGQAPFQYLKELPVAEIKLDRSFLVDLSNENLNRSIVRSVSVLAEGVGCDVVAVGVESGEIWEQLIALGCKKGQGFFFAPPMPAHELANWRSNWSHQIAQFKWETEVLPAVRQI